MNQQIRDKIYNPVYANICDKLGRTETICPKDSDQKYIDNELHHKIMIEILGKQITDSIQVRLSRQLENTYPTT
jgi:hypothetical protein